MTDESRKPIVVVTGANRGLGLETSRQLAQAGYRVLLTGRKRESTLRAAGSLSDSGLDVRGGILDVADPESVGAFAGELAGRYGEIDALINNAAVSLEGFDEAVARRTLDVNLFGAIRVTDALLPLLTAHGRVVMVSSGMGETARLRPPVRERFQDVIDRDTLTASMHEFVRDVAEGRHESNGWPANAYTVSKVGLNAFTRCFAREIERTRISVNAVCPGWVRTDMGGGDAVRSVEEGADGIVWAAMLPEGFPSGGLFRDRKPIPW